MKIKNITECVFCGVSVASGYTTINPNVYNGEWGCVCEDCFKNLVYKENVTEYLDKEYLDKLTKDKEGWKFISKNGIPYSLLEGMTIGCDPQYTSDMIFIMCDSDTCCEDELFVGWFCGANSAFKSQEMIKDTEQTIREYVNKYEAKLANE